MKNLLITLKHNSFEVKISPLGAEIKQFKYRGLNYLHDGNPQYWMRVAPYLFPNIGALKNDQVMIDDKVYFLPKHGFLRNLNFEVDSQTERELTLSCRSNFATFDLFPFSFHIIIAYEILNDHLVTSIEIRNTSIKSMPFCFGLHPAFKVPLQDGEKFTDYEIKFDQPETANIPYINLLNGLVDDTVTVRSFQNIEKLPLNYDDYREDALIFSPVKSHKVSLQHKIHKHGIEFSFTPFPTIAFWTPSHINSPFICIEPWMGQADSPNSDGNFMSKKNLIRLKPGESHFIMYKFKPLLGDALN